MRSTHILILTACLAAPVTSQAQQNVAAVPNAFSGAYANGPGPWSLNPNTQLYPATLQWWYRGNSVGGTGVIKYLGLRDTRGNPTVTATETMTAKLDNSSLGFGGLNKTWSKNLSPSATQVFSSKLNWQVGNGNDPNKGIVWVPASTPFVFTGPNLLVQSVATAVTTSNNQPFGFDALDQGVLSTVHSTFGRSCGGQLAASYMNNRFGLTVTGAAPNRPVTFAIGFNSERFNQQSLPMDLTPLGMQGCDLNIAPLLYAYATADKTGTATFSAPYTLPLASIMVKVQAHHPSAKTTLGIATTNATTSVVGSAGLCNGLYALGGSQTASGGPYLYNSAPILLLR